MRSLNFLIFSGIRRRLVYTEVMSSSSQRLLFEVAVHRAAASAANKERRLRILECALRRLAYCSFVFRAVKINNERAALERTQKCSRRASGKRRTLSRARCAPIGIPRSPRARYETTRVAHRTRRFDATEFLRIISGRRWLSLPALSRVIFASRPERHATGDRRK